MKRNITHVAAIIAAAGTLSMPLGCESLPGDEKTQGAVIGGAGGAAAGAAVGGEDNRLEGALIGGLLGAGGGYLIGQQMEKKDRDEAVAANDAAVNRPASANQALSSDTADLNNDGFVTLDEVVAMEEAGISDAQQIRRLQLTGQVFSLNASQEQYLIDRGVSVSVINAMEDMNRTAASTSQGTQVIGSDTTTY